MKIEEAIIHALDTSKNMDECKSCRDEHKQLAKWLKELKQIKDILGDDYDLDRLRELVEADRDGRCVVLPVKPHYKLYSGEEIYMVDDGKVYMDYVQEVILGENVRDNNKVGVLYNTGDNFTFCERAWGETVFLSRESAEAALKRGRNEENEMTCEDCEVCQSDKKA